VGAIVLALTAGLSRGVPSAQVRDRIPASTLVGGLVGRVQVTVDRQIAPVRRAYITLDGGPTNQTYVTQTDTDGHYSFDRVPPGTYEITIEKPGYVRHTQEATVPRQRLTTLDVELERGAALEGEWVDARGDPLVGLEVHADRLGDIGDQVQEQHWVKTDDLGRFRVHSLPAGRYVLHATPDPSAPDGQLYYPGTHDPKDAKILTLTEAQTLSELNVLLPDGTPAFPLEPAPAVDRSIARGTGRSRVTGRVQRADSGVPMQGAVVRAVKLPTRGVIATATTDRMGQFQFLGFEAGRYVLTATLNGFACGEAASLGGLRGIAIDLAEDSQTDEINFSLVKAPAIEGVVHDEFGDPVPNITVHLAERQVMGDSVSRVFTRAAGSVPATTDDRGHFRIPGVPPSNYFLLALAAPYARPDNVKIAETLHSPSGFAPTYFPSVAAASSAQAISVVAGHDMADLQISLLPAETALLSGRVVDQSAQPVPDAELTLVQMNDGIVPAVLPLSARADADGRFSFADVPEGQYALQAANQYFGTCQAEINVNASRLSTDMVLPPLATARGRVILDGDAPRLTDRELRIAVEPTDALFPLLFTSATLRVAQLPVSVAGPFIMKTTAAPGVVQVTVDNFRWALKAVRQGGRDVTNAPIDFRRDVTDLDVVLTSHVGAVTGTVMNGDQPSAGAAVVLFSAEMGKAADRFGSRTVTDPRGKFNLFGILPGDYLIAAVPPNVITTDALLLERLQPLAMKLSVNEGENPTIALKLIAR
jgi:protocatechuate 3,4-dioxygenase beta subunit